MPLTHKPRELLDYGLKRGQLASILGFCYSSQWWNISPLVALPSPLNYNLIMTKDHQCINDLFWNIPFAFPIKDQVYQGLLGTLLLSQEDRRDFVTQTLILIWLLQNELACCGLTQMETNLQTADPGEDVVHIMYKGRRSWPVPCTALLASAETRGIHFFDVLPSTWYRLSTSQNQALIHFFSFQSPPAVPSSPHSSSNSSQGSFLSNKRIGSV